MRRDRPGRAERRHALAHARVAATRQVSAASCSSTRPGEVPPGRVACSDGLLRRRLGKALAGGDARRHLLVRLAERQPVAHERLGDVGGHAGAVGGGRAHALGVEVQAGHEQRGRAQRAVEGRNLGERELLVLLQVAVVGQRQALADGEHGREAADRDARAPAQVLGHLRILLLRHHRGAERDRVVELRERELLRREHDHLLGQAREVHEPERAGVEQVADEVAVGDGVERVVERAREAELRRPSTAGSSGRLEPGQRARAERALVGRGVGRAQPLGVALEHPGVRGQVVAEQDRLRALQVRVAGQHEALVGAGAGDQRLLRARHARAPARARRPWPRGAWRRRPGRCASARRAPCARAARASRRGSARGRSGRPRRARRRAPRAPRRARRRARRPRAGSSRPARSSMRTCTCEASTS